jgi:hypothetical protein
LSSLFINRSFNTFCSIQCEQFKEKLSEILGGNKCFINHFLLSDKTSYINWEISDNVPQNDDQLDRNPEFRSVSLWIAHIEWNEMYWRNDWWIKMPVPELDMHESKHFLPGQFVHSELGLWYFKWVLITFGLHLYEKYTNPNFAQFLFELLTLNGTKCIEGMIDE